MTGYHKPGSIEQIGVITDNVDPDLTDFLRKLIDEYAGLPWVDTACGYGCSDHAVRSSLHSCSKVINRFRWSASNVPYENRAGVRRDMPLPSHSKENSKVWLICCSVNAHFRCEPALYRHLNIDNFTFQIPALIFIRPRIRLKTSISITWQHSSGLQSAMLSSSETRGERKSKPTISKCNHRCFALYWTARIMYYYNIFFLCMLFLFTMYQTCMARIR